MPPKHWESYELIWPREGGPSEQPVSAAMKGSQEAVRMLKLMSRVEDLGWTEAQKLRIGTRKRAKKRIVKKDDDVYLLKGTTLCWRLYLYVRPQEQRLIYIHAVCKKRDAEDPSDHQAARTRYERRAEGELFRIKFP